MLKTLRVRFVLVNMAIVTIMLGLILGSLYISTCRNLEQESIRMMGAIAMNPMHMGPPGRMPEDMRLPYFTVLVDDSGRMMESGGGFFDLSDKALLREIIDKAGAAPDDTGILNEYGLRFLRTATPAGQCFVFADITTEQAMLRDLAETVALIGCTAFLVFLGISVLLSKWAVHPMEKAWQQQKQFVADASHELKTPLTVIMTNAELLRAPACPDAEREQLSAGILTMSLQMRGLVESLLELARLDSGTARTQMAPAAMSELVSEAAMLFEPVFFEKGLTFTYEIEPGIILSGSAAHLRQLADILLDNAAKYVSPGGDVRMSLRRSAPGKCLLTVSNRGEPIPEEELAHLFERFYRADKARTRSQSFGLGLSIAESIAAEHRGKIRAESCGGYNSFYVELPL